MLDRHAIAFAQFIFQGILIIELIIMFFLPFNMNIAMLIVFVAMMINGGFLGHYLCKNVEY